MKSPRLPDGKKIRFHDTLGRQIRRRREAAEMTQRQLGEILHVSHAAIDKYEHGITPPPSYVVWQLAHIFNCTTDDLLVDPSDVGEAAA